MLQADIDLISKWAGFYAERGMNALPMRPDAKRPFIRYADYWERPVPPGLFDRYPAAGIQVMTGRRWRLLVIDLDGPEARERWASMGRCPATWATHSGGDGLHLWFRLPAGLTRPIPTAFLWRGEAGHSAIERLCDHSLIVAPPSIHPTTGRRYRFLDRRHSPARLPMPADCPRWILHARPIGQPAPAVAPATLPPRRKTEGERYDRRDVLESVPDKIGLARSWGVLFRGRRSPSGWVPCHAIDREDRNPSAAVHERTGSYCDLGSGLRLSFFDLAATLGVYPDWRAAMDDLGNRYCVRSTA
jgi:hypothetical protein